MKLWIRSTRPAKLGGLALLLAAVGIGGCDKPRAHGDTNQILVGAPQDLWHELEDDIKDALEPRTFTVRDERVFDVAHVDPQDPGWGNLRLQRQVLLIGDETYPIVAEVLNRYRGTVPSAPALVQVPNMWAQNQLVTVALLPPGAPTEAAQPLIDDLGQTYLRQFEDYARARMFVTGPNTALADSLRREAGFTLTLPRVYHYRQVEPEVFVFRNDQPDPSRLIRNITVDSRPSGEVPGSAEAIAQWRADLGQRLSHPPQVTDARPEVHTVQVAGRSALQIQGVWSNPPGEWPAAGPFIARMVECPDQTYLVDAWLYAPGTGKYEYMYQLNTILNSFECTRGVG
jgi:hypothetical protein